MPIREYNLTPELAARISQVEADIDSVEGDVAALEAAGVSGAGIEMQELTDQGGEIVSPVAKLSAPNATVAATLTPSSEVSVEYLVYCVSDTEGVDLTLGGGWVFTGGIGHATFANGGWALFRTIPGVKIGVVLASSAVIFI